ncbi:MAG: transcription termination/antitermination protein NusG [Treponemataceae bacterium]
MAAGWYILHTYSGYENKIERSIRILIENGDLDGTIVLDVKVPVEEVVEVKDGKRKVLTKKFLPGYILVEMDLPDLGWKAACATIKKIQGVSGFVGYGTGKEKPRPISPAEAKALLQKAGEIKGEKSPRVSQSFAIGEQVKVIDGPFATFTGSIEEVNLEKNKLKVMVGIFGRATPVEVDLLQVEKI